MSIKVWNVDSGECVSTLLGHSGAIFALQRLTLAYYRLASGSSDGTICIWDASKDGSLQKSITMKSDGQVTSLQEIKKFWLMSGSSTGTIKMWSTNSGQNLYTLSRHTKSVSTLEWMPSRGLLASGSYDSTVRIWNVTSGECERTLRAHNDSIFALAFFAGSSRLGSNFQKIPFKIRFF